MLKLRWKKFSFSNLLKFIDHLPLKDQYPNLVSDVLDPPSHETVRSWNLWFHWDFQDWEMEAVYFFFFFFYHIYSKLKEEGDKISWIHFKGVQLLFLEILYMIGLR